jgi:hypothetical protein
MSKSMLEYTKMVLKQVSFDASLFCKELEKACKNLLPHELKELANWVYVFTKKRPELRKCLLRIN